MAEGIRKSGIDIISDIPWGTHLCQFYKTKEDLIDILVPFFKAGLENNEFCMWVTSEQLNVEDAKSALKSALFNLDDYIEKGQIEILDASQWYIKSGAFDADHVLEGWIEKEKEALKNGFEGLRLNGNTFWLEKDDWKKFTDYEEIVHKVIGDHQMLGICSYSLDKCDASKVIEVVANHQFAIIKREDKWGLIQSSERKLAEEIEELYIKDLKYLSETAMGFIELAPDTDIYQYIAENIKKLVGNSIIIINSFDPETDLTCVRAIVGMGKLSKAALKILGKDPVGTTYKINEVARHQLLTGKYHNVPGKMYELTFGQMPKLICNALEKLFGIREIHSMGFTWRGELFGNVVIILRDDTEVKNKKLIKAFINQAAVALQRKHAEEALKETEDKYKRIFENVHDMVIYVTKYGKILDVNDRIEEIFGYKRDEVVGKNFMKLGAVSLMDLPRMIKLFKYAAKVGKIEDTMGKGFNLMELEIKRKNGEKAYIEMSTRVLKIDGKTKGFLSIIRDITERKRMEEELLQSKKLASIGMLAAGVAHEINNPLTNISILTANASKMSSDPEIKKSMDEILKQIERTTNIVRNLSTFSSKIKPNLKSVNLIEAISDSLTFNVESRPQKVSIITDFNPDLPTIKADFLQLQQVFGNLIKNAYEAMPNGGKLTVTTALKNDKFVETRITDTGVGISKGDIEKIFDPFYTKKSMGEGIGLGLSICHGIVEAHNGSIEVESDEGKSTTFIITLPVG